ncbi:MAG TPA: transglycosylase SLT domain-containing protein [Terracidiphilus sp.]|nr:transglycosylase SLT domain-containing protein [Terracidiphilus sp.]
MRFAPSPVAAPARLLAAILAAWLAVAPFSALALQASPDSAAKKSTTAKGKKKAAASGKPATSKAASKKSPSRKPASRAQAASDDDSAKTVSSHRSSAHKKAPRLTARRKRKPSARAIRFHQAFVASTELRPMAQQLITMRTPAAYAGVTSYAERHTGDAAAAAYLALGNAYFADHRYADSAAAFVRANKASNVLDDYADFLAARAHHEGGEDATADTLLRGFSARYPDSIFAVEAPELEANVLVALKQPAAASRVLDAAPAAATGRPGYQLARAQVALAQGQTDEANNLFKHLLLSAPLSSEAETARNRLAASGADSTLTADELRSLADAYYRAGRYELAADRYRTLAHKPNVSQDARDTFDVAAAACDLKLKRLSTPEAEALPDTDDDNGARRSYLLMELARNRDDRSTQQTLVDQMHSRFPHSQWLAEALFSSGNMYMLAHDYPRAVGYYADLAQRFPDHKNASAAHWRAGWLDYRQNLFDDAGRMFDEQIRLFPSAPETAAALYWRSRIDESRGNKSQAAARYRAIVRAYDHFFYAQMARQRLQILGSQPAATDPDLDRFKAPTIPPLDDSFPEDSDHLARARLLANAGLSEYIPREIAADPDSGSWSALAEAQIYNSDGDTFHAMRALKRALPFAASAPVASIPLPYWRILFPEPYWDTIKAESAKNNLDPYLVASLIRQESEFNASAVSYANAWGLMQLLPVVGKAMAREEGLTHFDTYQLLNPETNIKLGTRYLRHMLDHFDGVTEYALAAYNAGDSRVVDWRAAGPYSGMDEFVESIPFAQTREYVQSILRNIETYRDIDAVAAGKGSSASGH